MSLGNDGKATFSMEEFIRLIRTTDNNISILLTSGGCYKFGKLLQQFYPSSELYIRTSENRFHVITKYQGTYYDINGVVDNCSDFRPLEHSDIVNYTMDQWDSSKNIYLHRKLSGMQEAGQLLSTQPCEPKALKVQFPLRELVRYLILSLLAMLGINYGLFLFSRLLRDFWNVSVDPHQLLSILIVISALVLCTKQLLLFLNRGIDRFIRWQQERQNPPKRLYGIAPKSQMGKKNSNEK